MDTNPSVTSITSRSTSTTKSKRDRYFPHYEEAELAREEASPSSSILRTCTATATATTKKRQKQWPCPTKRVLLFSESTSTSTGSPLLNLLSDDALMAHVMTYVGPMGTAQSMQPVCHLWNQVALHHPSNIWKHFVLQDYMYTAPTKTDYGDGVNWHKIYGFLTQKHQQYQQQKQQQLLNDHRPTMPTTTTNTTTTTTTLTPLPARVVFADDGGNFPGYPAHHVVRYSHNHQNQNQQFVWCTATGVERNVDCLVELTSPSLITSFIAANGGRGYSAPLHQALAFVSLQPPSLQDMEQARDWYNDDRHGPAWVNYLMANQTQTQQPHDNNNQTTNPPTANMTPPPPLPTPSSLSSVVVPVAAFEFPHLQRAFDGRMEYVLAKPIVGQYILFKLLNSHSPAGLEDISDNIDLMHLHTMGISLHQQQQQDQQQQWEALMQSKSQQQQSSHRRIPDYPRQYPVRTALQQQPPPHRMVFDHNHDWDDGDDDNNNDHNEEEEEEEDRDDNPLLIFNLEGVPYNM